MVETVKLSEEQERQLLEATITKIQGMIEECARGISDREADALLLAEPFEDLRDWVTDGFARARPKKPDAEGRTWGVELKRRSLTAEQKPEVQPAAPREPATAEAAKAEYEGALDAAIVQAQRAEALLVEVTKPEPEREAPKVAAEPKRADAEEAEADAEAEEQAEPEPPQSAVELALPGVAGEVQHRDATKRDHVGRGWANGAHRARHGQRDRSQRT
jgi:hypothetical protein